MKAQRTVSVMGETDEASLRDDFVHGPVLLDHDFGRSCRCDFCLEGQNRVINFLLPNTLERTAQDLIS